MREKLGMVYTIELEIDKIFHNICTKLRRHSLNIYLPLIFVNGRCCSGGWLRNRSQIYLNELWVLLCYLHRTNS